MKFGLLSLALLVHSTAGLQGNYLSGIAAKNPPAAETPTSEQTKPKTNNVQPNFSTFTRPVHQQPQHPEYSGYGSGSSSGANPSSNHSPFGSSNHNSHSSFPPSSNGMNGSGNGSSSSSHLVREIGSEHSDHHYQPEPSSVAPWGTSTTSSSSSSSAPGWAQSSSTGSESSSSWGSSSTSSESSAPWSSSPWNTGSQGGSTGSSGSKQPAVQLIPERGSQEYHEQQGRQDTGNSPFGSYNAGSSSGYSSGGSTGRAPAADYYVGGSSDNSSHHQTQSSAYGASYRTSSSTTSNTNGSTTSTTTTTGSPSIDLRNLWSAQISSQLDASQLCLGASIWMRDHGMGGMAAWMLDASETNREMGLELLEFAMKRKFPVNLEALSSPNVEEWDHPVKVWAAVLKKAHKNTEKVLKLAEMGHQINDSSALACLQPFHMEQLEVEHNLEAILDKVHHADMALLQAMDYHLGLEAKNEELKWQETMGK